ncbi:MAG: hypothetical protein ABWZ25_20130 [Chitinophagaceae bacterium]
MRSTLHVLNFRPHRAAIKINLLILCIFSSGVVFTQTPFEGRIDYLLTSRDSTVQIFMSGYFSGRKIFIQTKLLKVPGGEENKEEKLLLDFENGFLDRINDQEKQIVRQLMTGPAAQKDLPPLIRTEQTSTLQQYKTVAYQTPEFSPEESKDSVKINMAVQVRIWYAEDLLFEVPEEMKLVQMVPLFSNGHIALASSIKIGKDEKEMLLNTRATEVRPGRLAPVLFQVPHDYRIDVED